MRPPVRALSILRTRVLDRIAGHLPFAHSRATARERERERKAREDSFKRKRDLRNRDMIKKPNREFIHAPRLRRSLRRNRNERREEERMKEKQRKRDETKE